MSGHTAPVRHVGPLDAVALTIAVLGHLLVGWFTISLGLLAPLWAIVAMGVLWLVGAVLLVRLARSHPRFAPVLPLVHGALLVTVVTVGERVLGWTA